MPENTKSFTLDSLPLIITASDSSSKRLAKNLSAAFLACVPGESEKAFPIVESIAVPIPGKITSTKELKPFTDFLDDFPISKIEFDNFSAIAPAKGTPA